MQTCVLGHSIENKSSRWVVIDLEELSCLRYIEMRYATRAVVNVSVAKGLSSNWVSAERSAIVTHSKMRKIKTGSLPARYVKIEFIEGEVRLIQELIFYGRRASDIRLEMEPHDTELYLNNPYTFIYN